MFLTPRSRMIRSKLTAKAQTTIPRAVRHALGLEPGDEIVYEVREGVVILRKADPEGADDPFATFAEWDSPEDREAYADL